jgi:hypothetical protein
MSNISTNSIAVDHEESPAVYTVVYPLLNHPIQYRINDLDGYYVLRGIDPRLNNIRNYRIWSILNILFCCFCVGFVACHYSYETDSYILKGNVQGALKASRNARITNVIATLLGIIIVYSFYLLST